MLMVGSIDSITPSTSAVPRLILWHILASRVFLFLLCTQHVHGKSTRTRRCASMLYTCSILREPKILAPLWFPRKGKEKQRCMWCIAKKIFYKMQQAGFLDGHLYEVFRIVYICALKVAVLVEECPSKSLIATALRPFVQARRSLRYILARYSTQDLERRSRLCLNL